MAHGQTRPMGRARAIDLTAATAPRLRQNRQQTRPWKHELPEGADPTTVAFPSSVLMKRSVLRPSFSLPAAAASAGLLIGSASDARAEDVIISRPGDHPDYFVELEPEAIILFGRPIADGPGVGVRASIPLMKNGFVSSINNVPAITFGISRSPIGDENAPFYSPVALQWSFWLSQHWSVLGEAGVFVVVGDGARLQLQPALMAGARLHLVDRIAITARVSLPTTPSIGVGVSFFL